MDTKTTVTPKQSGAQKLTRAERKDVSKQRLFEAAAAVVGEYGYAGASITRITQRAGIGQGTFYNHFGSRQELLEKLLPAIGHVMLRFIRDQVDPHGSEEVQEQQRFAAFFTFLERNPSFLRILIEAPHFAVEGYQLHMRYVTAGYTRLLRRIARQTGRRFGEGKSRSLFTS
jgi:AcrR family transcriptional regulator